MGHLLFAPLLTERDPVESSEGTLDPLGMAALADALANRLAPGVTERQRHPRFLTSMAVSLAVCSEYGDEALAADQISEPWMVFEWYLVEGLVRSAKGDSLVGLPGSRKATNAIADGVPLSAKRYLKTPTVFGFHGVYRRLANALGIEDGDRLGEAGFELLSVWAAEQRLEGFTGSVGGPGQDVLRQLRDAVQAGLEKGATARSTAWSGWEFFRDHLAPYARTPREATCLASMLREDHRGFRQEVLEHLVSASGRRAWEKSRSEREFHCDLLPAATDDLRTLLVAIDAYEEFARLCSDAFQDCLCEMTRQGGKKTSPKALAALPAVKVASQRVPANFGEVADRLEPVDAAVRFRETFSGLAEPCPVMEWAERLVEHHRTVQRLKPPTPKNPWFERFDDGSVIIRPDYLTDQPGTHDQRYVHPYRTAPMWQFALDLRLVTP